MMELMPSDALANLVTQLKGLELYARQYYLSGKPNFNENGSSTPSNGNGETPDPNTGGGTEPGGEEPGGEEPGNGGNTGGDEPGGNGGGDNPGGGGGPVQD